MLDKTIEVNVHPKYSLLFHCDDCGEYKGLIYSKENKPELHKRYSDENNPVIITCLCDGIKCVHCSRKKHRPISDYYDVESDTIIHVAYFTAKMPCKSCKEELE